MLRPIHLQRASAARTAPRKPAVSERGVWIVGGFILWNVLVCVVAALAGGAHG